MTLPGAEVVEVSLAGRVHRVRFTLAAMDRLQRALGCDSPKATLDALLNTDRSIGDTAIALWAASTPVDGGPRFASPEELSEAIDFTDWPVLIKALWLAISTQFPGKPQEAAPSEEADPLLVEAAT